MVSLCAVSLPISSDVLHDVLLSTAGDAAATDLEHMDQRAFLGRSYAVTYFLHWPKDSTDENDEGCMTARSDQSNGENDIMVTNRPYGTIQGVQMIVTRGGTGRVFGLGPKYLVSEPASIALEWLSEKWESLGLKPYLRAGMDCTRLLLDYDAMVDLPPTMERTESHLAGAIFLAAISMVTGWKMDQSVSV